MCVFALFACVFVCVFGLFCNVLVSFGLDLVLFVLFAWLVVGLVVCLFA